MSNARYRKSAHTPRRPNSEQESGSSSPEQVLPGIQYSAIHYQGNAVFKRQLFSSDVKSEHPGFLQAYDRGSDRPWVGAPSLMPFRERNQLMNGADHVDTDAREGAATFAIMSPNLPPSVLGFGSNRPLLKYSPRVQSELHLNIDWYQMWLTMRTESLHNSNDFLQFHPGVIAPAWPFSMGPKGEQQ